MLNFEEICRVCMQGNQELWPVFNNYDENAVEIAIMLAECTVYKVLPFDELPQHVCSKCMAAVKSAYYFKLECENSYKEMKQLLINSQRVNTMDPINTLACNTQRDKGTQTETSAIHPCEQCEKKFLNVDELSIHRSNDHKGKDILCRFCFKKFDRLGYLRTHIAMFHPELGYTSDSKCHVCDKQFSRRDHMRRHLKDVHKIVDHTNKTRKSSNSTHTDVKYDDDTASNKTSEEDYDMEKDTSIDPICTVLINESFEMGNLILKDLKEEVEFGNNCDEFTREDVNYAHKFAIHDAHSSKTSIKQNQSTNFNLLDVNTDSRNEIVLRDNIEIAPANCTVVENNDNMSSENSNYECNSVDFHSSCSSDLNDAKESKSCSAEKNVFFCNDCGINFANESQYEKHYNTKHHKMKHSCSVCDKVFNRKSSLMRHVPIHKKNKFTCRECTQIFVSKSELDAHKKSEGHNKPMLCPECGLRCKSFSSLTVHMRRHTGEKPFKCKFCNKGFPRPDDVRQHERYHTGERNHFCETCGKGFQRKYHLTMHLRIHTGEKPHKCPHCTQAFSQSHDLKLHIRRHTGERLRCVFCEATFLQGYQLRHHKFTEHGIKEEPPTQRLAKFTSLAQQEEQIKEIQQQKQFSQIPNT